MHRFAVPLLLFLGTGCLQPTPLKLGDDSSALVDTAPDTGTPGTSVDKDQDGYPAPEDCDDDDPLTNPGSLEVCDGIDNDCDGGIDNEPVNGSTFFVDEDGDGFGVNPLPSRPVNWVLDSASRAETATTRIRAPSQERQRAATAWTTTAPAVWMKMPAKTASTPPIEAIPTSSAGVR